MKVGFRSLTQLIHATRVCRTYPPYVAINSGVMWFASSPYPTRDR